MQIKEILADDIVLDWGKNKSRYERPEDEKITQLSFSLEEEGQKHPVHLFKNKEKKFEAEIGFCRIEALKILNRRERAGGKEEEDLTKVKYILITPPDEKTRFLDQLAENHNRTNWTPMDYAQTCKVMTDELGMTQAEIADKLGFKSQGSVSGYISLFKLSKNLQLDVHKGLIPYSKALEILKEPENTRQSLADQAKSLGNGKVTGKSLQAAREGSGNPKELNPKSRDPKLPNGPPKGETVNPLFTRGFTDLWTLANKWEKKNEQNYGHISAEASMVVSKILSWAKGKVLDEDLRMFMNRTVPEVPDDIPIEDEMVEENKDKEEEEGEDNLEV